MSYVARELQSNETVLALGRLHWVMYARSIGLFGLGTVAVIAEGFYRQDIVVIEFTAILFYLPATVFFIYEWIIQCTTEFAVTNKRIIYKRGIIARHTAEMNMVQVETVDVDQNILGRILNFGTLHVLGTGQGIEHLHKIAAPLKLRTAILTKE
jgi:uncharacterized membrane protein YdbT with pleckstrin-like domain